MAKMLNYYGGKGRMAPRLASVLPAHRAYVEPFCGSAAVLFAKEPAKVEVLNDLDGLIVNLFRVVRDRREELEEALALTPYSREEGAFCRERMVEEGLGDVERARRYFVAVNASFSGTLSGFAMSTPKSAKARTFSARLESIRGVAERLRNVELESSDALKVIARMDSPETAFYVDPPYLAESREAGVARGYRLEAGDEAFHGALLSQLLQAKGGVVLSGYAHPLYEEALQGWGRMEVPSRSTAKQSHHGARTEVVWSNRPRDLMRWFS